MIIHTSVSEINPTQWDELVEKSPTATFFQTRTCFDFYSSLSFLKPFIVGISENDVLVGILCGYIIADGNVVKRFFSRRAIVPGGVLLAPDVSVQAVKQLLDKAKKELANKAIYLELRNYNDYTPFRSAIEDAGFEYRPHLNFHVATPDAVSAFNQLNSGKQRQINQTFKAGASIVEPAGDNEIEEFYTLLKRLYTTKIKLPLFPLEFFIKLYKSRSSRFLLVKYEGRITGGIVCVLFKDKVVYEWFVCGDDGCGKNVYSSVLATWAGIEYAATNGYARFDFMGAGKPDEGYGVREFKSKFGGELLEYGRFIHIADILLYTIGKKAIEIQRNRNKRSFKCLENK